METTYLGNLNEAGTTNNNSGKSSCHLAILKRTSILDILNVVIMMRMTEVSYSNLMKMLIWACYGAFVAVVEERGATAMNPKMVSRQHIGSGSSWRYRRKRELCGCAEHAKDGGVIPVTGFPHDGGKETRNVQGPIRTWCKHEHLIQHTRIRSRASSRGYTFEACVFGADRVRTM